ncbi:MAG: T9SS type A sorting domain-containing protein [Bacteroidetes bacterium]|nr:T9SS type A sorting domain-containing protein [Bacteroidota bacterium]
MKKISVLLLVSGFILVSGYYLIVSQSSRDHSSQQRTEKQISHKQLPKSAMLPYMAELQWMKLRDPQTGEVPSGIRSRELAFASGLPVKESSRSQVWNWRGPDNIGGRMLCIAIDMDDEDHILSGSASGGMWQSADGGQNWSKVTAPDAEQSATCLIQDSRPGKHNTWYYGTGELLSTTKRNVSTNVRTIGIGDGIFKSTDNGATWEPLPYTQGGSPAFLDEVFQGVWKIVTDPVTMDKDIVYAACYGAIMRSEDGGASWQMVLGDMENKSFATDIAITTEGILYAAMSSYCWSIERPAKAGIWRSVDGIDWKEITPPDFPEEYRVTRLVIAPSNENVLYIFTETPSSELSPFNGVFNTVNTFWKYTRQAPADTGFWDERSSNIPGGGNGNMNSFPFSFMVYGGYTFDMKVGPEDENVVFLAAMNMFRSDNGFADSIQTTFMGGYPFDMDSLHALHPDQHGITFLPSDPDVLFMANDGGVYINYDCMADSADMVWNRLNNKLTTTQFYSVTIDHEGTNDDWILGGLQDNNWYYTVTDDPSAFWFDIDICFDGFATCVAPDWEYCIISAYSGNIWTTQFDTGMHTKNIFRQLPDTLLKFYNPIMGSNSLFPFYQNFALDPNNYETFYLPTITSIWRKANLKAASYDSNLRNAGWEHLSNVDVGDASEISYITISKTPANRIYYGTNLGRVYKLDDAHTGNGMPVEITGPTFPYYAFVACIDIDENNADNIMVVFSNYNVQSIYYSEDGGITWSPQGGNLEENPDGTGSGPSIRWVKSLTYQGHQVWFAGTSVGLYSTNELKGDSTIWKKEGASSIGSVLVDMIDARQTDGFIAVGTQGNGVYSTWYDPAAYIEEPEPVITLFVGNPYPNPSQQNVSLEVNSNIQQSVEIILYTSEGKEKALLYRNLITPGRQLIRLNVSHLEAGMYYVTVITSNERIVRKLLVN